MRALNYLQRMKAELYRSAVSLALRRKAPSRIPMSDPQKLRSRNYFTVSLGDNNDRRLFLVESIQDQGMSGLWFDEHGTPYQASIGNLALCQFVFLASHYIREIELRYDSAIEFVLHQRLGWGWVKLAQYRFGKLLYNQTRLVRADRIKVLQHILEHTIADRDYRASDWEIMENLYGHRWVLHRDNLNLITYYSLVLDSLVETRDLVEENNTYTVGPRAIDTLARHEEDERRHRDSSKLQRRIVFLTFCLAVIAAVQAYVSAFAGQ